MREYDEATTKFMKDIAGSEPENKSDAKKNLVAKQGVSFVKGLATGGIKALPANVLKRAINLAVINSEKTASAEFAPLSMWKSLNERYGNSWWDWEPETIWQTLTMDFMGHPDDDLKNLIQALQVVCKTNFAFEDWSTFEKVGHAFNSNHVTFEHVQLMDLDEIALTVEVLKSIRRSIEWSSDIYGYIAASAKHCGVVYLPDDIFPTGCQEFLDKMGNNLELKEDVIKALKQPKIGLSFESPLGIQLLRIDEIRNYVSERI